MNVETDNTDHINPVSGTRTARARRSGKRPVFYLVAVLLGLSPFIALEILLRVFGIGEDAANAELHSGFGNVAPLFELDNAQLAYRTSHVKEQFFVADSFSAKKSANEFRIFCLGGSTVQGRPYRPETSFGQWLELELNATGSNNTFNVVNCGGISYASYRLRPVLKEVLNYEPDLIIVATGHNEFLEDRTYDSVKSRSGIRLRVEDSARSLRTVMLLRKLVGGEPRVEPTEETEPLPDEVETRLDNDAGYASYHRDEEWRAQVCDEFAASVTDMAETCNAAGVPIVLVRLGGNLRDCPPFKSEHRVDLSVEDEQTWQALFDEAAAVAEKDAKKALELYQRAARIDDQYPLLHFRIARTLDRLGRFNDALVSYQAALDQDICPLRMSTTIVERLKAIATEHSVPLVDAESAVAAMSPHAISGYDVYIDHVHPTIGAHQRIATEIVHTLREQKMFNFKTSLTVTQRRQLYKAQIQQLESTYYSNGRRRIGWLEGWARRQRLFNETLPVDVRGYVSTSSRYLDLHRFDSAFENMVAAVHLQKDASGLFVKAAAAVFQQGRVRDSRWILEQLQQCSLSDEQLRPVDLGLLVLAFEDNNAAAASQLFSKRAEQWPEIITNDDSGWVKAMPDVSDRIRRENFLPSP